MHNCGQCNNLTTIHAASQHEHTPDHQYQPVFVKKSKSTLFNFAIISDRRALLCSAAAAAAGDTGMLIHDGVIHVWNKIMEFG